MPEWGKVPWTLWAYAGLLVVVGGTVVASIADSRTPVAALILFVVFLPAWAFFLLKGVRWLWIATIASYFLFTAIDIADGSWTWPGGVIGLAGLALLVFPTTRRFFGKGEPAST